MPSSASLLLSLTALSAAQNCNAPPPAKDFDFSKFSGAWYEIARIQTPGGAALQDWCACTELIYSSTPGGAYGDLTTLNSCRFLEPSGFFLNATSYLENMTQPGHWLERYCPECPAASYNIILDGEDSRGVPYAVEYDCSNNALFGNNYCLHFLSRQPLGFDTQLLNSLVKQATQVMKLNPENRPLNHVSFVPRPKLPTRPILPSLLSNPRTRHARTHTPFCPADAPTRVLVE
jgi:hypothetical protein